MLGHFRHARGAAGVEIGAVAVVGGLGEIELVGAVDMHRLGEIEHLRLVARLQFRADEGGDPGGGRREIAAEIDLQHRLDIGREGDGLVDLLGEVGLGERREGDDDLGAGLAQDGADGLGGEQRVDRVDDARRGAGEQGDRGFEPVRQDVGDHVGGTDTEAVQQVGGAGDLGAELAPGERDGLVARIGLQLEADRRAVGKPGGRLDQLLVEGACRPALRVRHRRFRGALVVEDPELDHVTSRYPVDRALFSRRR